MDLSADPQVRVQESVEGITNDPFSGVFNRDDTVVDALLLHLAEDGIDALERSQLDPMTEPGERRQVRVAAGRAPIADRHRALQSATGGDDLAVDRAQRRVRKRAGIDGGQAAEHLL